ncbi:MAG: MmcQ/YjbR family DNA-binding protein [Bacilli bacterium]|nr:MmcQ/YjbR family DNA-binding protein [Bacilli bacterium]
MELIKNIFYNYKVNTKKLLDYGFILYEDIYTYKIDILNDTFEMRITIKNNEVNAKLFDKDTLEEYPLIFMDRVTGEFVGKAREAFQEVLLDVRNKCFNKTLYPSAQANRINKYIKKEYDVDPEFPWAKYTSYGVYRNNSNGLWFGLIMDVMDNKLAPNVKGKVVINIKPNKSLFNDLLKVEGIYPGWHMNKKSWLSISLDDTLSDEFVQSLIDSSYNETVNIKKTKSSR